MRGAREPDRRLAGERRDGVHAVKDLGCEELDPGARLRRHEMAGGPWPWPNEEPGVRRPPAKEIDHRPEAGVTVLRAHRVGVDEHHVGDAKHDGLVEPGGIVVEEGERSRDAVVESAREIVVAGEAVEDPFGHAAGAYTVAGKGMPGWRGRMVGR